MEIPIKMDDLGGKPTIFGNIHISLLECIYHMYDKAEALLLALGFYSLKPTKKMGRKMAEDAEKWVDPFEAVWV